MVESVPEETRMYWKRRHVISKRLCLLPCSFEMLFLREVGLHGSNPATLRYHGGEASFWGIQRENPKWTSNQQPCPVQPPEWPSGTPHPVEPPDDFSPSRCPDHSAWRISIESCPAQPFPCSWRTVMSRIKHHLSLGFIFYTAMLTRTAAPQINSCASWVVSKANAQFPKNQNSYSWFYHILTLWASQMSFQCLGPFVCKMGISIH